MISKKFSKFLKDNNFRKIRLHNLRQSILLNNMANLREVQGWCGHSNVSTTKLYTHLDDFDKIAATNAISEVLQEKVS